MIMLQSAMGVNAPFTLQEVSGCPRFPPVAGLLWFRRRQSMLVGVAEYLAVWLESERPMRLAGPHSGGSGAVVGW
jgi:hypothetical protein